MKRLTRDFGAPCDIFNPRSSVPTRQTREIGDGDGIMSRRLIGAAGAAAIAAIAAIAGPFAAAAEAPAVNWGSFTKEASVASCTAFAEAVLRKEHLRVLNRAGSVLLAGNNSVVVEVACYPSGDLSGVVVAAFSTDPETAERTRRNVRATIERIVCTQSPCR